MRAAVAWISVSLLTLACFAPWTAATLDGEIVLFGAQRYLIVCAIGVAAGLLARRPWLSSLCAAAAVTLTALTMYSTPGTLLHGAYLALASSLVLVVVARAARRSWERAC